MKILTTCVDIQISDSAAVKSTSRQPCNLRLQNKPKTHHRRTPCPPKLRDIPARGAATQACSPGAQRSHILAPPCAAKTHPGTSRTQPPRQRRKRPRRTGRARPSPGAGLIVPGAQGAQTKLAPPSSCCGTVPAGQVPHSLAAVFLFDRRPCRLGRRCTQRGPVRRGHWSRFPLGRACSRWRRSWPWMRRRFLLDTVRR